MTRRLALLLSIVASLALAACGNEPIENEQYQSENAQVAETEGIYVTVDEVKYQVQMSKQLNPQMVADQGYLKGVNGTLADDEEWFAVWVLAQNFAEEDIQAAADFEIADTQEKTYVPVTIGEENEWAYRPRIIEAGESLPDADDPQRERFPNGAMLLFKVKRDSLNNRPLELNIRGQDDRAIVNLDV
jgi:hypothetical protein